MKKIQEAKAGLPGKNGDLPSSLAGMMRVSFSQPTPSSDRPQGDSNLNPSRSPSLTGSFNQAITFREQTKASMSLLLLFLLFWVDSSKKARAITDRGPSLTLP
jgi:hypothetical protein